MIRKIEQVLELAKGKQATIAVVAAEEESVLQAVADARREGLADFVLFGPQAQIAAKLRGLGEEPGNYPLKDCSSPVQAAHAAARLVSEGGAHTLMKGNIKTGSLLKVLLESQYSFRTGNTMSLCGVFEVPTLDRLLIITDPGMVIAPTLEQKVDLVRNAVQLAHALQNPEPRVGVIAAVEVVNPKMPATLDAAVLATMNLRHQLDGCIVDGPFALDNVVSLEAARHKGLESPVAGKADILLMPDIEAGNILYKALVFLANARAATTILGGSVPLIVTSRADSSETKMFSIALNVALGGVQA